MKTIKGFITVLSVFAILSCVTAEKSADNESKDSVMDNEPKDSIVENKNQNTEKKMKEVEVKEITYFISKEEAFYDDGQIDTITDYTYDKDFNLISQVQTNEQGEVLESSVNRLASGQIVRTDNFGFGNVLNSYTTYTYDKNGNVLNASLFDNEDKLQSANEYEYSMANLVVWKTLGPSGGILAITEYKYDGKNNLIKIEMKTATGDIDGVIEKSYDKELLKMEKVLDSKGKIEKSTEFIYDGDNLIEKIYMDAKGKKKRSESFEFADMIPVPKKINMHYKSGALEAYTLVQYDTKVVKSTILVEE